VSPILCRHNLNAKVHITYKIIRIKIWYAKKTYITDIQFTAEMLLPDRILCRLQTGTTQKCSVENDRETLITMEENKYLESATSATKNMYIRWRC